MKSQLFTTAPCLGEQSRARRMEIVRISHAGSITCYISIDAALELYLFILLFNYFLALIIAVIASGK